MSAPQWKCLTCQRVTSGFYADGQCWESGCGGTLVPVEPPVFHFTPLSDDDAMEALRRQVAALTAERERLHTAIRAVVDTFTNIEAQGLPSRSRQFALNILARQLEPKPNE